MLAANDNTPRRVFLGLYLPGDVILVDLVLVGLIVWGIVG